MYAVVVRETGESEAIEGSEAHLAAKVVPRVREAPGAVSALWMTGASKPSKLRSTAIATLMSWWTTSAPSPTDALICGNSRSASHSARTMNGR